MQLKVIRCNTVMSKLLNLQVKVSQPGAIDVLDWFILCHGALTVLCFVGCLAASLASAFWVPVASPFLQVMTNQCVSRHCQMSFAGWRGGQICHQQRTTALDQFHYFLFNLANIYQTLLLFKVHFRVYTYRQNVCQVHSHPRFNRYSLLPNQVQLEIYQNSLGIVFLFIW